METATYVKIYICKNLLSTVWRKRLKHYRRSGYRRFCSKRNGCFCICWYEGWSYCRGKRLTTENILDL